jgi:hypothetical protein
MSLVEPDRDQSALAAWGVARWRSGDCVNRLCSLVALASVENRQLSSQLSKRLAGTRLTAGCEHCHRPPLRCVRKWSDVRAKPVLERPTPHPRGRSYRSSRAG